MIMDVSFSWQQDREIDADSPENPQTPDSDDCDITQKVAALQATDETLSVAKNVVVDPYDNDYWIRIPLH